MPDPEIICAGMFVADVLAQGLEALPIAGETGFVSCISFAAGGDANNQAVALAKLGNRVGLLGMTGDDVQGEMIRRQATARGIDTRGLCADPKHPTQTAIVIVDRSGERRILIRPPEVNAPTGLSTSIS
jgi:sugar/nucleoside kinase (ribokinase family)